MCELRVRNGVRGDESAIDLQRNITSPIRTSGPFRQTRIIIFLFTSHRYGIRLLYTTHRRHVVENKADILQGTLDLMVLQTLAAMGPLHGYGIARRIEQISDESLKVNQGTIYLCLVRLMQKRWIKAEWGTSENNRKARFYSISKAGQKQLVAEAENWQRVSGTIGRLLQLKGAK